MAVGGKSRAKALVAFLVLAGTAMPPASATTVGVVTFVGNMQLGGPLDWACPVTTTKCTATTPGLNVAGGPKGVPVVEVVPVAGNARSFTTSSVQCADITANAAKPGKPPSAVGPCSMSGAGVITGFCNLATGTMTALFSDSLGQAFRLAIKFTWLAPPGSHSEWLPIPIAMLVTGTATKLSTGATAWVVGEAVAVALPSLVPGNNCFTKTATNFTLAGSLEIVIKN